MALCHLTHTARWCFACHDLVPALCPQIDGALPALTDIEMPLVRVLASMESAGIALDPDVFKAQRPPLEKRLLQLQALAYKHAGGTQFNLASAQEVSSILFEQLKLPVPPNAVTGK